MSKSIFVQAPSQLPECEHWAIIGKTSVSIPGDERSRTNPGHGYPASTEHYVTYEAFTNEDDFKTEMTKRLLARYTDDVRGIHVSGVLKPKQKVQIDFEEMK